MVPGLLRSLLHGHEDRSQQQAQQPQSGGPVSGLLRVLHSDVLRLDRPPQLSSSLGQYFEVVKELGAGSYSKVLKVRRRADGQLYALKASDCSRLMRQDQQSMLDEIRLLSGLRSHPNLIEYLEAFAEGQCLYVVVELAAGDLAGLLDKRQRHEDLLSEREVWSFLLQILCGLAHLHANHVLHRDLKPANLLLGADGVLRISDLGVSQELSRVYSKLTWGTVQYMAPEMHRRKLYSYSADMWALGCIAHELCTLQPLFLSEQTRTEEDVKRLVLAGRVPALPGRYSPELRSLISALLQPDPAARPTAREVLETPAVAARMASTLPPGLLAQHNAAMERLERAGSRASLVSAPRIPLPPGACASERGEMDWLNCWMPPVRYKTGGMAVAEAKCLASCQTCPFVQRKSPSAADLWHLSGATAATPEKVQLLRRAFSAEEILAAERTEAEGELPRSSQHGGAAHGSGGSERAAGRIRLGRWLTACPAAAAAWQLEQWAAPRPPSRPVEAFDLCPNGSCDYAWLRKSKG